MITFETPEDKNCFIDPSKVIGVVPCMQGSKILLEGGVDVVVLCSPKDVMAAIEGKIKWVNMKINLNKVLGVSLCSEGSKIHFEGGSEMVVRGTPLEVWEKLR